MAKLQTAAQLKREFKSVAGELKKSNPYWYTAQVLNSIDNQVSYVVLSDEYPQRTKDALENWAYDLREKYIYGA